MAFELNPKFHSLFCFLLSLTNYGKDIELSLTVYRTLSYSTLKA